NAGSIVASASAAFGIFVNNVAMFGTPGAGGIVNTGAITADFNAIDALGVSVFSGGIENDGTLAAKNRNGVLLEGITTFAGGINNKGTISAVSGGGIAVGGSAIDGIIPVAAFAGSISNVGTISARTGIAVHGSTIGGAIIDSGAIRASSDGIL